MTTIGRRSFLQRAASAGVALLPRGVRVSQLRSELSLGNEAIGATWAVTDGRLRAVGVVDRLGGRALAPPVDVFTLTLADGTLLPSSELRVEAAPRMTHLAGVARAARASVIGTTEPGELRRGFLDYVERERAHPYRPFLHYNSWYDIGYFSKYDEAAALAVIEAFGRELHQRRGVRLDSFLFDDGWDDPQTLWRFHPGFPRGFASVREAAARYGAAPGAWLSPWRGYGRPPDERLAHGRTQGFETNEGGFALSGPRYYARFRETCLARDT